MANPETVATIESEEVTCSACQGSGFEDDYAQYPECGMCGGSGFTIRWFDRYEDYDDEGYLP